MVPVKKKSAKKPAQSAKKSASANISPTSLMQSPKQTRLDKSQTPMSTLCESVQEPESPRSTLTEPREVLFLIPWGLPRPFFSKLCWECELLIGAIHGVRPIFRCLHRDPDGDLVRDASLVLMRELQWTPSERLIAVVVAPTGDAGLERSIAEFCGENRVQPIALSLPFHSPDLFKQHGFPQPPVVWADGTAKCEELGMLAADRFSRRPERPDEMSVTVKWIWLRSLEVACVVIVDGTRPRQSAVSWC